MTKVMQELVDTGTTRELANELMTVEQFESIVKMDEVHKFERETEQ